MIMAAPITRASEDSAALHNALFLPGLNSVSILLPPVRSIAFTPYNAASPGKSTPRLVDLRRA
jgi:hypothetical protein